MKYPAIHSHFLNGSEPFIDTDGNKVAQLIDFWSWAYSDLTGNTERGALAEYIVACALGIQRHLRTSWDKYDLLSSDDISIEVKASGYIQTWGQDRLSSLKFNIQPTLGWDSKTNQYDSVKKRQADLYIFCVHNHTDQSTINPLIISQWDFYPLATKVLNDHVGQQKSITLAALKKLGIKKCAYEDLRKEIQLLKNLI